MIYQRRRKPNPFDSRAAHRAARYQRRRPQASPDSPASASAETNAPQEAATRGNKASASAQRAGNHAHSERNARAHDHGVHTSQTHDQVHDRTHGQVKAEPHQKAAHPTDSNMANPQVADQSPTDRAKTDRTQAQQAPAGRATQYFAGAPTTEDVRRTITVTLRGRDVPMDVSNGVFSTDRLDLGTRVLLKHAPQPPAHGTFLDLGCGWGPIAVALALESPHADVWAVDVNERALDLTRSNAERNGCANVRVSAADAVPQDIRFDLMWSNPPIRIGKEALHELLMQWLVRLTVGGRAYLVVQRNLGADSLIPWLQQALDSQCGEQSFAVSKNASSKGYRVIEIVRAR